MNLVTFVARIRDHYVEQFRAFAKHQRESCTQGASEIKLQLSEQSELFDHLYCVDFIKNDGNADVLELQPDNILTFDPISGAFGKASLLIKSLRWDDVLIQHDLSQMPSYELSRWFRTWFDPEDERHDPSAEISGAIHSLRLQPSGMSIDFGTAPPGALWDILELLEGAGATRIEISSSRAVSEKPH